MTLTTVSRGTDVYIAQAGISEAISAEACYLGWEESLGLLGKLLEAEILE